MFRYIFSATQNIGLTLSSEGTYIRILQLPLEETYSQTSREQTQLELHRRLGVSEEPLSTYIGSRFALLRGKPDGLPTEERSFPREVQTLRSVVNSDWMHADEFENAYKSPIKAFMILQEFYIVHHAERSIIGWLLLLCFLPSQRIILTKTRF